MATQTGSYLYYNDSETDISTVNAYYNSNTSTAYKISDFTYSASVLNGDSGNLEDAITLELNYWVLDGTTRKYYENCNVGAIVTSDWTVVDDEEDDSCKFLRQSTGAELTGIFLVTVYSDSIAFSGITLNWAGDAYPTAAYAYIHGYSSEAVTYTLTKKTTYFALTEETPTTYARIYFRVDEMSLPYRLLKINKIVPGLEVTLTGSAMRSAKIVNECSLNSETLPASSLTFTFESEDGTMPFKYGAGIKAYGKTISGSVKWIGTYYIDTITRKTTTQFTVECLDAIAWLDNSILSVEDFGDAAMIGSSTVGSWLSAITDYLNIDNAFWNQVKDISTTNTFFPTGYISGGDSMRTLLQQILFSGYKIASTDYKDGRITIWNLSTSGTPTVIDDSRVYQGNTLDEMASVNSVTEIGVIINLWSNFTTTTKPTNWIDIYNSRNFLTEYPESAPSGSHKAYKYDNYLVGKTADLDVSTTQDYRIEGDNARLVSNVIPILTDTSGGSGEQRGVNTETLFEFYQRTKTAKCKITWNGEKLADLVTVPDPYGGTLTGNIQKMTFTLSNITAVEIEVLGLAGQ